MPVRKPKPAHELRDALQIYIATPEGRAAAEQLVGVISPLATVLVRWLAPVVPVAQQIVYAIGAELRRRGINSVEDLRNGMHAFYKKNAPIVLAELEGDREKNYPARDKRRVLEAIDAATAATAKRDLVEIYDQILQDVGDYVLLDEDPRSRYVLTAIVRMLREDPIARYSKYEIAEILGVDVRQVGRALDGADNSPSTCPIRARAVHED